MVNRNNTRQFNKTIVSKPSVRLFAVMVAVFVAQWMIFSSQLIKDFSFVTALFEAVGDAVLLFIPYWLLKNQKKWLMMLPMLAITIFFTANSMYFEIYDDVMEPSAYKFWSNVDKVLVDSAIGLFNMRHAVLSGLFLMEVATYFIWFRRPLKSEQPFSGKTKWMICGASVLYFIAIQISYSIGYDSDNGFISNTKERLAKQSIYRAKHLKDNGLAIFWVKDIAGVMTRHTGLTADELAQIREYNAQTKSLFIMPDSVLQANRDKNLILLVVESLNDWAVERTLNGRAVMPTLQALAHAQGTIYAPHITNQSRRGMSSDGQMLYVTGLLPTLDKSVAFSYGDNAFIALPKYFPERSSFEIIGDERTVWNHDHTNRSFGYDTLYDISSVKDFAGDIDPILMDKPILKYAVKKFAETPKPFYAMVSTLTMHLPYTESPERTWISEEKGLSEEERNYLEKAAYFDRALSEFIADLKASGLYDSSVLVIAGDHTMQVDGVEGDLESPTTFMAINTGVTRTISGQPGQIDVFPTILDIMWLSPAAQWRGLGLSMLNPLSTSSVTNRMNTRGNGTAELFEREKTAWGLSSLMIKNDFFATHHP